jgi:hypothetical protein
VENPTAVRANLTFFNSLLLFAQFQCIGFFFRALRDGDRAFDEANLVK